MTRTWKSSTDPNQLTFLQPLVEIPHTQLTVLQSYLEDINMTRVDTAGQFELVAKQLSKLDVKRGLDALDSVLVVRPLSSPLEDAPN